MSNESVQSAIYESLEAERKTLKAQLSELGFGDAGRLDYDSNFADASQVTAERGEVDALAASLQEALEDVDRALAKFSTGNFGRCEKCDNPIAEDRLEAMPTGRLCISCASSR